VAVEPSTVTTTGEVLPLASVTADGVTASCGVLSESSPHPAAVKAASSARTKANEFHVGTPENVRPHFAIGAIYLGKGAHV
jgi:hypothetical protein